MKTTTIKSTAKALSLAGAAVILFSTACGGGGGGNATTTETGAALTSSFNINIAQKSGLGSYLIDSKGMTFYWTTLDAPNKSNVSGAELATWPAYYSNSGSFFIPGSLSTFAFDNIVRADGANQTTYQGWPMYYYSGDKAPGDTLGQGVGGVWFVIHPTSTAPGK
jgi:predicted lipoprotein with Yx(FWY)xxD motif